MIKFCRNCGREITEETNFCPYCGFSLVNNNTNNTEKTNSLALSGFIVGLCSLFINFWGAVGVVATVLSAVGLSQISSTDEKGKGMAIAGLIIGIFSILYGVFALVVFMP